MVKGLSFLMLITILETYVCSGLCISDLYMCCDKSAAAVADCCKSQQPENNQEGKTDCQDQHLAFFQTIGQFHSIDVVQLFQPPFISELYSSSTPILKENKNQTEIAFFTGFHPPPPKDGISVFVQTFLI